MFSTLLRIGFPLIRVLQDLSVTTARSLGISSAIVSNPVADMPDATVKDLLTKMSEKAAKAQDLAVASVASSNKNEAQVLAAASIVTLDRDLRSLRCDHHFAEEAAGDLEGYIQTIRHKFEKEIEELRMEQQFYRKPILPRLTDSEKAEYAELQEKIKAMKARKDREYMAKVEKRAEYQEMDSEEEER
ncbi:hypothetical protein VTK56DRAFT_8853 [Thermocarpiscus australiensis]